MAISKDTCRLSGCACHPSRRGFIALAAGAAFAGTAQAQEKPAAKPPHRIDVHHHILPPKYIEVARDRLLSFAPNFAQVLNWKPADSIEQMDRFGIRTAMTSLSNPGTWFGKAEEARALARMSNDYAAEMARDYPGRFGVLAALSLPDVDGSLAEIAYAYDVLKADGIAMLTSYGDKWPGDEAFVPVFEELNRRGAVVYFHPTAADCCSALLRDVPAPAVEYMFDTTRAITSLLFSGALTRWRNVTFIFSHAGGATAPIVQRMIRLATVDKKVLARMPEGPAADLKRLYFDTATSTAPENLGAMMRFSGPEKFVLGTDYPFLPMQATLPGLAKMGFDEKVLQLIERDNALRLFPRLRNLP